MSDSKLPPDHTAKPFDESMSVMPEPAADFAVGYGRPPASTQFKKGQSGNPGGRPKGRKNLRTLFIDELATKVPIRIGDEVRTVSKAQAIAKRAVHQAMQGDPRAITTVIGLDRETVQAETKRDTEQKYGVLLVPEPCLTMEEYDARYEADAQGRLRKRTEVEAREYLAGKKAAAAPAVAFKDLQKK